MQPIENGNLLEIIDLAHSLRQEHLFIVHEQNSFNRLNETLNRNSSNVAQVINFPERSLINFMGKIEFQRKYLNSVNFSKKLLFFSPFKFFEIT